MKMILLAAVALAAGGAQAATRYEIDPAHSRASFSIRHMMVTNVKGEFGNVSGEVMLDDKDPAKSSVKATIDVRTINTGVDKRDAHLKSGEFFDVEKFPTMTFESTKVAKGEKKGSWKVDGNLTLHGVTKPVTLTVDELSEPVKNPMMGGMVERGASAATTINRKDFGLTWAGPALEKGGVVLGDEVKVSVDVELQEKAAAPAKTDVKPAGDKAPAPKK
ncbi:MAG TPA: YceI family protein [Myxococcaceae bacterium]|nr:YceI family protein [Myxococcaceae bacterium]